MTISDNRFPSFVSYVFDTPQKQKRGLREKTRKDRAVWTLIRYYEAKNSALLNGSAGLARREARTTVGARRCLISNHGVGSAVITKTPSVR